MYALRLRGRKRPALRWTFTADDEVVAAPAYSQGKIFAVTSNGSVYAIDARNGREVWHATSFSRFGGREYFYATPAVAYGRVYAPNADGSVYAYRPGCPACGASLGGAAASGAELTCASCGHAYDVVLAGRCRDAPELHLDPLPLLVDDAGLVRVALGSGAACAGPWAWE